MMNGIKFLRYVIAVLVLTGICGGVHCYLSDTTEGVVKKDESTRRNSDRPKVGPKERPAPVPAGRNVPQQEEFVFEQLIVDRGYVVSEEDLVQLDEDLQDQLTDLQQRLYVLLQKALEAEDLSTVRAVVARINRMGKVPVALRAAVVAAFRDMEIAAMPDLMPYIVDPDPEVSQEALEGVLDDLSNPDLSDYERAETVKAFLESVTDADLVETLLDQLLEMRNSVKADTVVDIMQNGSSTAKKVLFEYLETYLDEGITSVEDVQKWKLQNPDEPEDPETYGGLQGK